MAESTEIRQGVREMLSPEQANERLEQAVSERPLARHLIDLKIVGRALLIAAVLTIVTLILFSAVLAAVVLVISFFAAWILLASRSYEKRRPTRAVVREGERIDARDDSAD
jgi:VIT1/CCC1 family predicted Fe2+/Mn2+ transporter